MRLLRRLFLPAGLGAVFLLAGCAYQLGPTGGQAAGAKSIDLRPFANQTMEPRLGDALATALRRNLQHDGTYRLASHGTADIVVTGELTRYDRYEMSFVPRDVLTVNDYRVSATARITVRDTASGKTILDQEVTGYTLIRVGNDLTSAERQAVPLLADDLARNMTTLLVNGSW